MDALQKIIAIEDLTDDQMRSVIKHFQERLKLSKEKKAKNREPIDPLKQAQLEDHSLRKRILRAEDKLLKLMLHIMDDCNAQGFFYGIIHAKGNMVTATSDSLREWLQEKVRFDHVGLEEIERYYSNSNNIMANRKNTGVKSLMDMQDATLGSMLSALVRHCDPPQNKFPLSWGCTPPWWPTADEEWWVEAGFPTGQGPPPYKKPHDLKKAWKAGVLAAVIKHLMPRTSKIYTVVRESKRLQHIMTAKDNRIWKALVGKEEEFYLQAHPESQNSNSGEVIDDKEVVMILNHTDSDDEASETIDQEEASNDEKVVIDNEKNSGGIADLNNRAYPLILPSVIWNNMGENGEFHPAFNNYQYAQDTQAFYQQPMTSLQYSASTSLNFHFNHSELPPPSFSMRNAQPCTDYNLMRYGLNNSMPPLHPQYNQYNPMVQATMVAEPMNNQAQEYAQNGGFSPPSPFFIEDYGF